MDTYTYQEIENLKDDLTFYKKMYDIHNILIKRLENELNILYLHIKYLTDDGVNSYGYSLAKSHYHSLIEYLNEN